MLCTAAVSKWRLDQVKSESLWWISKCTKLMNPKAWRCTPLDFYPTASTWKLAVWYFMIWMPPLVCMITFVYTWPQPAIELLLFALQTERLSAQVLTCGKHIVLRRWQKRKWEIGLDSGQSTCLVLACRKGWCGWVSHGNFNSDFNVWKRACVRLCVDFSPLKLKEIIAICNINH